MTTAASAFRTALEAVPDWPKDPLHYYDHFPLRDRHYPAGVPLELSTNSPEVIAAAEQSWSAFPKLLDVESLHIRMGVWDSDQAELPPAPSILGQRGLITIIGDSNNFGVCDVTAGFAFGWMTPNTVADPAFFRYHFLDLMAGMMLTSRNFGIVHSACVSLNGRGVLLCGHSKAGKSTLSFACAQRGWTFISDDAVYTIRKKPGRSVIGNPMHLRLRPDAARLFPQLENHAIVLRQNGEFGFEIPTAELPGLTRAFTCEIDHVVFLNRAGGGSAQISPLPKEFARKWLENVMGFTFTCNPNSLGNRTEMFLADPKGREEQNASLEGLLGGGIHEMCYSDLDSAIDCLESLVEK